MVVGTQWLASAALWDVEMKITLYSIVAILSMLNAFTTGCAMGSDGNAPGKQQQEHDESLLHTIPIYMTAEELYPNESARSLAVAAGEGNLERINASAVSDELVNYRGYKDVPPLFWAFRNFQGFAQLLHLGADPNAEFASTSVIHWAAQLQDERFLKTCLEYGANSNLRVGILQETPIFKTISVGEQDLKDSRKLLIQHGADINARTKGSYFGFSEGGVTPLLFAADLRRFDIVLELLTYGADASLKDGDGRDLSLAILEVKDHVPPNGTQGQFLEKVISWLEQQD